MPNAMLNVSQLSCARAHRTLFDNLSFEVQDGDVTQVVGANGSGKTTLFRILLGLYSDYQGTVTWAPHAEPVYVGHEPGVKDALTAYENLQWMCQLHESLEDLDLVLDELGIYHLRDVKCADMSSGERKRVGLARLHLLPGSLWVLDEPFSSLDASGMAMVSINMDMHVSAGGAVLLTSHQPVSRVNGTIELGASA